MAFNNPSQPAYLIPGLPSAMGNSVLVGTDAASNLATITPGTGVLTALGLAVTGSDGIVLATSPTINTSLGVGAAPASRILYVTGNPGNSGQVVRITGTFAPTTTGTIYNVYSDMTHTVGASNSGGVSFAYTSLHTTTFSGAGYNMAQRNFTIDSRISGTNSGTINYITGINLAAPSAGNLTAGTVSITNLYGIQISNQGTVTAGGGTVTVATSYGLRIESQTGATTSYAIYSAGGINYLAGDIQVDKTITAAGTTGAQTINKNGGSVNFAAAATSLVVTDSRVSANSIIVATVATNDSTMKSVIVVPTTGSFTIYANAAATAETRVNWVVIN